MKTPFRFFRNTPLRYPMGTWFSTRFLLAVLVLAAPACLGQLPVLVKDIRPGGDGSSPNNVVVFNGALYFSAFDGINGSELWKSDGTAAGTVLVKDINPGAGGSVPTDLTVFNGVLYFEADDGITGDELWKSDGTAAGTVLVKNIDLTGDSNPDQLTGVNGVLYFTADNTTNGYELWKTDGTEAGTVLVKDIYPGGFSGGLGGLTAFNGVLYFRARDDTNGFELWKTDGTGAGTVIVKDIYPGGFSGSPFYLTVFNGVLYFEAGDGTTGRELWKSDGTGAGTVRVTDLNPGGDFDLAYLTVCNGALYFRATDGTTGYELYKSDGTAAGTVLVKDLNPGGGGSEPNNLTVFNGVLYFEATDGTTGRGLWKSDGTAAGTVLVKDINPGSGRSHLGDLTAYNGVLYFRADDGTTGFELWKTDGTAAGTVLVKDLNPGSAESFPNDLTVYNGVLYFAADDGTTGFELWKLEAPLVSVPLVSGTPVCAGQAVTLTFTSGASGPLTAQLSDASGSFANPTDLGSVSSGSNSVVIPLGIPSGTGYRIRVVLTDDGGEIAGEPSGAFSVTGLAANFNSNPTVSLTPACAGGSIRVSFTVKSNPACAFPPGNVFTAQLSDATGSFAAPVTLGTVSPGITTVTIPESTPTGTGYRVRIAATTESSGSAVYSAVSAVFTVNQPAFASTPTVSGDNKCAGQAVRLSFAVTNCPFFSGNSFTLELSDASGSNFASIPGTVTPGALNNVVIPAGTPAGTGYKLRVKSSNPALTSAASASFRVKACNNREMAPDEPGLRVVVSPNPSPEGRLRISVSGVEGQALRVELFNGTGQTVREASLPKAGGEEVLDWDVSRQPAGLYLLRVSDGREAKTLKVLH